MSLSRSHILSFCLLPLLSSTPLLDNALSPFIQSLLSLYLFVSPSLSLSHYLPLAPLLLLLLFLSPAPSLSLSALRTD